MDAGSVDGDLAGSGVKILILQLSQAAAVHCVGDIRAEGLQIETFGAAAHLLVGGEADADLSVSHLRMGDQPGRRGHDLRHSGLVVGPQQGGAVCCDQILPLVAGQVRELRDAQPDIQLPVQADVRSVVVLHQLWMDVRPGNGGRGVHMGDQPQGRGILTARGGGNDGEHVAVLAEAYVLGSDGPKLVRQLSGQRHLARRAGNLIRVLRGHGINGYIAHKTVNYFRHTKSLLFLDSMGPVDPVASPRADDK